MHKGGLKLITVYPYHKSLKKVQTKEYDHRQVGKGRDIILDLLKDPIEKLKEQFQDSADLTVHEFEFYHDKIRLVFLQTLCDDKKIKDNILQPLMLCERRTTYVLHLLSLPASKPYSKDDDVTKLLLEGNVLILLDNEIIFYKATKINNKEPQEANVEMSVLGPKKALSENLDNNITLVRSRYPTNKLKVENSEVGTMSKTKIAILYDVDYVQHDVLDDLKERLSNINIDMIQAAGQLENALTTEKFTIFPTMMITERPDRIALNLSQGKIVILLDGTPFSLILPAVFFDFISSMDDLFHAFWVKQLMVLLRYSGLLITITLPSIYIAITGFNPEILRSQLALTIAGSRAAVPYPAFFEVILMLLAVEMLVEASIRLPTVIGPTATTVGGLILGQAAQQAQLVSAIMIIITAFVAISNFTIPINAMSFAVRCLRYPLIILSSLFGIIGLIAGLVLVLCYLTEIRSFGKPYLAIYWGSSKEIRVISETPKEEQR